MVRTPLIRVTGIQNYIQLQLIPGSYLFELYGASGGGSQPGKGGFASGILHVTSPLNVFLFPGGKGSYLAGSGCLAGGWNGGGSVCTDKFGSSGGGASDVRLQPNNISSRIIVAGGGGGSGDGQPRIENNCPGGDGGGYQGGKAVGFSSNFPGVRIYSNGGTQTSAGTSVVLKYGLYMNTDGSGAVGGKGAGGRNFGGGGGGGYFGGGGGFDVTGGGGGSSYISSIFRDPKTLSGSQTKHIGDGIITIYQLTHYSCNKNGKLTNTITCLLLIITLCKS